MGTASQKFDRQLFTLDELGVIRGLIEDATKDTAFWLQANASAEEQVHVLAIQGRLADLDRIIARRMELRSSPKDGRQWSEAVAEVMSRLDRAKEVRGNIVGKALSRLAERLSQKPPKRIPPAVKPVNTSLRSIVTTVNGQSQREKQEGKQATQLPASLRNAGDPVDGNPFPSDDLRHKVWRKATLNAEEEACRADSEFLKKSPAGQQGFAEWMRQGNMASAAQDFADWALSLCVAKFDIWAKRGIQVVRNEAAIQAYDQWLFNYAQSWLKAQRGSGNLSHSALLDLRSRLIERVEYWKAEARRYLSEQRNELDSLRTGEKQAESTRPQNSDNTAHGVESNATNAATIVGRNINRLRKECGWSFDQLAEETGIDKKSILSHVNKGARPIPRILKEYAEAFSKALERRITAPDLEK